MTKQQCELLSVSVIVIIVAVLVVSAVQTIAGDGFYAPPAVVRHETPKAESKLVDCTCDMPEPDPSAYAPRVRTVKCTCSAEKEGADGFR